MNVKTHKTVWILLLIISDYILIALWYKSNKTHKRMVQEEKKKVRINNNEVIIKDSEPTIIGAKWFNQYMKEQNNKLLYCYIPKNVCTEHCEKSALKKFIYDRLNCSYYEQTSSYNI
eukprot:107590_1